MVQFIFESIIEDLKDFSNKISSITCGIVKITYLIPDGEYLGLFYRSGNINKLNNAQFDGLWDATDTSNYPKVILSYAIKHILAYSVSQIYTPITKEEINTRIPEEFSGIGLYPIKCLNQYLLFPILKKYNPKECIENEISCLSLEIKNNSYRLGRYTINFSKDVFCNGTNLPLFENDRNEKIQSLKKLESAYNSLIFSIHSLEETFFNYQKNKIIELENVVSHYNQSPNGICSYISFLLEDSMYPFIFSKRVLSQYDTQTDTLILDYILPNKDVVPNKVKNKTGKWVDLAQTKQRKLYDDIIYAIVARSLAEIFHYDNKKYIQHICFNGKVKDRSPFTGQTEEKYILSVNVSREQIESLNLEFIDPKECFKHLKGVSASKLYEQTEIRPIITPSFNDKRIVKARDIETTQYTNLAEMDWEEFEHLVRQVFEWEFSDKGGEVNVTQLSRDGGVDAIVFDPDPIRGGKIIIQAKRYTNTVPVSAVRDLYGTIINEGANKGILITTSDYGPDSYKFAQGKPITLLNGGHLLYLMEKHGRHARIDIQEAKENRNNQGNER